MVTEFSCEELAPKTAPHQGDYIPNSIDTLCGGYYGSGWTERLRRREATIAGQNDRGYLFEGRERVPA